MELYRVVMGGSGGYRRLPGGSDDFSLQTDRHFIIIYLSSGGEWDLSPTVARAGDETFQEVAQVNLWSSV